VSTWAAWLVAAVLLTVGEMLTPGMFFLGPVALAAVAGMIAALLGGGAIVQFVAFGAAAILSLGLLRPVARRHVHMPRAIRTGTAALEGRQAVVLERVSADGGQIRLGGEVWSARPYVDDAVFEPGARVEVLKIEGATALVH
jgi:membrane protein implicated in regulation of membrane protease activity